MHFHVRLNAVMDDFAGQKWCASEPEILWMIKFHAQQMKISRYKWINISRWKAMLLFFIFCFFFINSNLIKIANAFQNWIGKVACKSWPRIEWNYRKLVKHLPKQSFAMPTNAVRTYPVWCDRHTHTAHSHNLVNIQLRIGWRHEQ